MNLTPQKPSALFSTVPEQCFVWEWTQWGIANPLVSYQFRWRKYTPPKGQNILCSSWPWKTNQASWQLDITKKFSFFNKPHWQSNLHTFVGLRSKKMGIFKFDPFSIPMCLSLILCNSSFFVDACKLQFQKTAVYEGLRCSLSPPHLQVATCMS